MATRTTSVRLELITAGMQASAKKASAAVKEFRGDVAITTQKLEGMERQISSTGRRLTIGLTAPLALLARQAIMTAGTAQEAMNRVDVVFGRNRAEVEAWAAESVESMGLARHEAMGTAATFANMFTEMGLGADVARQLAMSAVQLSSDIGSFRDVDPTNMLEKMRAAVVGEYEPMRQLGIVLTDATVRQEAVRLGLADTAAAVDTAGKVQARYSLIVQAASKDVGDFERTNQDAVNAQRMASAAYRDAMAELGENLLPIVARGALTFADLAKAVGSLPESMQGLILGFGGLAAAAGPALLLTGSIIRNLDTIRAVGPKAAAGLRFAGTAAGLAAVAFALDALGDEIDRLRFGESDVEGITRSLAEFSQGGEVAGEMATRFGGDLDLLAEAFARADDLDITAWQKATDAIEDLVFGSEQDTPESARKRIDDLDQALADLATGGHADAAAAALEGLLDLLDRQGVDADTARGHLDDYQAALDRLATEEILAGDAVEDTTVAVGEQGDEADEAARKLDLYRQALDDLRSSAFAVRTAQDGVAEDLADFADKVMAAKAGGDEFATSLDQATAAGIENRSMLSDLVGRAFDVAAAMATQGVSHDAIAVAMADYRNQLVTTLTQLGFSRAEVIRYTDVLLSVPSSVGTTLTAHTGQAEAALGRVLSLLGMVQRAERMTNLNVLSSRTAAPPPDAPGTALGDAVVGRGPAARAAVDDPVGSAARGLDAASDELERAREEWLRRQDAFEENLFEHNMSSRERYVAYLDGRLAEEVEYSEAWFEILDRRARVLREHDENVAAWNEAVARNEQEAIDRELDRMREMVDSGRYTDADVAAILAERGVA